MLDSSDGQARRIDKPVFLLFVSSFLLRQKRSKKGEVGQRAPPGQPAKPASVFSVVRGLRLRAHNGYAPRMSVDVCDGQMRRMQARSAGTLVAMAESHGNNVSGADGRLVAPIH